MERSDSPFSSRYVTEEDRMRSVILLADALLLLCLQKPVMSCKAFLTLSSAMFWTEAGLSFRVLVMDRRIGSVFGELRPNGCACVADAVQLQPEVLLQTVTYDSLFYFPGYYVFLRIVLCPAHPYYVTF